MSGAWSNRKTGPRAQLPLLDRLIDDAPGDRQDPPLSSSDALELVRKSVRRDLEALLNTRRRWRSWPARLSELAASPVGYGLPDLNAGTMSDPKQREAFREEVERTIRRFEPRLVTVRVTLLDDAARLDGTLRLRIEGLLHAQPAPEPVAFDTLMEPAMAKAIVRASHDV